MNPLPTNAGFEAAQAGAEVRLVPSNSLKSPVRILALEPWQVRCQRLVLTASLVVAKDK